MCDNSILQVTSCVIDIQCSSACRTTVLWPKRNCLFLKELGYMFRLKYVDIMLITKASSQLHRFEMKHIADFLEKLTDVFTLNVL